MTNPESVSKEQQIVQNIVQNIVQRSQKIGNQKFASSQPKKHTVVENRITKNQPQRCVKYHLVQNYLPDISLNLPNE